MQFLAVVIAGRSFDLSLYLSNACGDGVFAAQTVYNNGIVFVDGNLLGTTQHIEGSGIEFETLLLRDNDTAGKYGYIFEHLFATVAKARSLDSTYLQRTTQTVYYQRSQSLAVDVLGNDEQRTTALCRCLQYGKHIFQCRYFLVIDEDVGVLHLALHLLGVGNEIGRDITAVELHTFNNLYGRIGTLGLLNGDNTIFFHLAHSLGNELAYLLVVVGRDAGYRLYLREVVAYLLGLGFDTLNHFGNSFVDTAFQVHGIGTGRNVLQTYVDDSLSQYGSRSSTVTGIVTRLRGYLFYQLGTHVHKRVFELYLFGNGYAIFRDLGSTEFLFDNHIAALGTEGNFYGIGQGIDAGTQLFASLSIEFYFFSHNSNLFFELF